MIDVVVFPLVFFVLLMLVGWLGAVVETSPMRFALLPVVSLTFAAFGRLAIAVVARRAEQQMRALLNASDTEVMTAKANDSACFVVELECGVWLAEGAGDPARTCVLSNAQQFPTARLACEALRDARRFRPFTGASVRVKTDR